MFIKCLMFQLLFYSVVLSQVNPADIFFPSEDFKELSSENIVKGYNPSKVRALIDTSKSGLIKFIDFYEKEYMSKKIDYYALDISGDGINDLVAFGKYLGSEELIAFIWIKENEKYYEAAKVIGTILKFVRLEKSAPYSIIVRSGLCCAQLTGNISTFKPVSDKEKISYYLMDNIRFFHNTIFESQLISQRKFKTIKRNCKMRKSPEVNNSSYYSDYEELEVLGNTLTIFKQGSYGKAIGKYIDEKKTKWFFVVMDGENKFSYNRFYNDKHDKKCGWINSADIEFIK